MVTVSEPFPKIFIAYETEPDGAVPKAVYLLDMFLTNLGYTIGTDYKHQLEVASGATWGATWALALWGILPQYDAAICVRATNRANRNREYCSIDWELETLRLHHRPILYTSASIFDDLSDDDALDVARSVHHDLLGLLILG